jgi:DNA-binding transcriptional ArsR family regulator
LVTYEGTVHDDVASTGGRDLDLDEPVFRALADGQRRVLLDRLFERDGQTLAELCGALPHLSRFGVMKHLSVLEHASLVTTRRDGRHKVHFLNPVPIRGIHDRWISKFAAPWIGVLTGLRHDLERPDGSHASHHDAIA